MTVISTIHPKHVAMSLLLLLTACGEGKDEPRPQPGPETESYPMSFTAGDLQATRVNLELTHTAFTVWGYKYFDSADPQEVIPGYNVLYVNAEDHWQYDGMRFPEYPELTSPIQYLKYWDASAGYYRFCGYACNAPLAGVTVSSNATDGMVISGLRGHVPAGSEYLVCSHQRTIATLTDVDLLDPTATIPQPTAYFSAVPLRFHSVLSGVEFRIYNAGNKEATIKEIRVVDDNGLITAADLTGLGWSNPDHALDITNVVANDYSLTELTLPANMKQEDAEFVSFTYEIPQGFTDGLRVLVDVNGAILNKTFKIDDPWVVDNKYIYYIRLDINDDKDPILVNVACEDFIYGGEDDLEETNW